MKEVSSVTLKPDTVIWITDTIRYQDAFEIKFTKKAVSIDGYGKYTITSVVMHGEDGQEQFPYYYFSNGMYLIRFSKFLILESPIKNNKGKTVVFTSD
jgi:hypothetical protein